MSIPPFNSFGVLPPFVNRPADLTARSPYLTTMTDVVRRFSATPKRRQILHGLIRYRAELRRVGVASAFQWLDGSFVENITREPNDVDVVTCAARTPRLNALTQAEQNLFIPTETKQAFMCDAYFLELSANGSKIVERTAYWYGLFSHRRDGIWKGMVQIDLDNAVHDQEALGLLTRIENGESLTT